jgi:hypothetical protein
MLRFSEHQCVGAGFVFVAALRVQEYVEQKFDLPMSEQQKARLLESLQNTAKETRGFVFFEILRYPELMDDEKIEEAFCAVRSTRCYKMKGSC